MKESFAYNEEGFFLIEHLISLIIVGILSVILLYFMQVISVYRVDPNALNQHEVMTLQTRIQNEVNTATYLAMGDNRLYAYFEEGSRLISFRANNGGLLRQVNGVGGEIMSYQVAGLEGELFGNRSARVRLISPSGESFSLYVSRLYARFNLGEEEVENDDIEAEDSE